MLRRPLIIIGLILLVIITVILIFRIDWGGNRGKEKRSEEKKSSLVDYANTDTKVRMTINGKVNSNEDHREIQITVGRDNVDATVLKGYQGNVLKNQKYSNNPDSYGTFLAALQTYGFNALQTAPNGASESGSCATGYRYLFDIYDSNETLLHSWSTSCSSKIGTFGGNVPQTRNLFEAQVPDYNDFSSDVVL